jgi:hypothetical protein
MYRVALFIHFLAAVALAAGNVAALGATITARRSTSAPTILALMQLHHASVMLLVVPSSILVLVSGAYLVQTLNIGFSTPWIAASLVAWLLAFVIGIALLVPAEKRALAEANSLVRSGTLERSDALRAHVGGRGVVVGEWLQQALILLFLYLMVFRPS